jgi:polyphosphate kinase 2
MKKQAYQEQLLALQVELTKLQRDCCIQGGSRFLVILEGRDAAGKDGTIKRIMQHLSPREVRVVALGTPTERETSEWYFQRWVEHLPAAGEVVLFNRSWYNRAGVERVMGFATPEQVEAFLKGVPEFERLLVEGGVHLLKYYLDVTKDEQRRRLADRQKSPLTQWKTSPIDAVAIERFDEYTEARNEMLRRSHSGTSPWRVVRADNKRRTRLAVIRDLLSHIDYEDKRLDLLEQADDRVRVFEPSLIESGWLAR